MEITSFLARDKSIQGFREAISFIDLALHVLNLQHGGLSHSVLDQTQFSNKPKTNYSVRK